MRIFPVNVKVASTAMAANAAIAGSSPDFVGVFIRMTSGTPQYSGTIVEREGGAFGQQLITTQRSADAL